MQIHPRQFWAILLTVVAGAAWILVFNSIPVYRVACDLTLGVEWIGLTLVVGIVLLRNALLDESQHLQDAEPVAESDKWSAPFLTAVIGLVCLWSILYWERWLGIQPYSDDFHYLAMSEGWAATWKNLFHPHNEHLVVPQRIIGGLAHSLGKLIGLPHALQLTGTLLFLAVVVLLFLFSHRLWHSTSTSLLAITLFSFTTVYYEVLTWYTASLWLIPLLMILMGMYVLTPTARKPIGRTELAIAFCITCLAPFSFSIGLIVGPLLSLWMLSPLAGFELKRWKRVAVPLCGTCVSLLALVPRMLAWFQTDEYLGSSSREALKQFDPVGGLAYGVRVFIDFLLLRNLGIPAVLDKWWLYALAVPLLAILFFRLFSAERQSWKLFPFFALIAFPYAMVLPFRSFVPYGTLQMWNRYNLIPHLGLTLIITGLVHLRFSRWSTSSFDWRHCKVLVGLASLMTVLQRIVLWLT